MMQKSRVVLVDLGVEQARRSEVDVVRAFIVGMSRSGTLWMSTCLNAHPDLAVFGETGFWGKHFIDGAETYTPEQTGEVLQRLLKVKCEPISERMGIRPGEVVKALRERVLEEQISLTPKALFDWLARAFAGVAGARWVIEKTPHHIRFIDRIATAYPEARFLVMYREAYGFMLSYKHQGDRKREEVRRMFHALYHPAGCAFVYRSYLRAITRARARYGNRLFEVSFERVQREPHVLLEEVQRFLEVEVRPDVVQTQTNSSFTGEVRPELAPIDRWWMNRIAGADMRALGTTPQRVDVSWGAVLGSLAQLPLWAARSGKHLLDYQMASLGTYLRRIFR